MRNALFTLIITVVAYAAPLHAACKTEECRRAIAWKSGYTAIVLEEDIARSSYFGVLEAVERNGGVVAIEAEEVLLGWVPVSAAGKIRAMKGVRAVFFEEARNPETMARGKDALPALGFFNRVVRGEYEDVLEAGLAIKGKPLTGCVAHGRLPVASLSVDDERQVGPSEWDEASDSAAHGKENRLKASSSARPGRVETSFWNRKPFQNPNMRGCITVQFFVLDSSGAIDPNLYTWTTEHYRIARDQVFSAFTFWVNQATSRGITLSFRVDSQDPLSRYTRTSVPTRTQYEPITHGIADDYLWVNDALAPLGYGASPITPENVYSKNEAFNRAKKANTTYGPFEASFSVYITYNPYPAPEVFADGYRAYAMYDGPFTTVNWNSGGWGPENLGRVLTHETGHIFWACDEYYDEASDTGCYTCYNCHYSAGPRNQLETPSITNGNCGNQTAPGFCDYPQAACMMDDMSPTGLCRHTPRQLGW